MPKWPTWPPAEDVDAFEAEFKAAELALTDDAIRRPSAPIITGNGFRWIADITCNDGCDRASVAGWIRTNPQRIPVIFVCGDRVGSFLTDALPSLRNSSVRFVLVVHNSDTPMPGRAATEASLLDEPLLVAWFAQNAELRHPRLHPIP